MCGRVAREGLEELGPAPFRINHDPRAVLQSDDFIFCEDLRAAGFRIGCYWDGHFVDHFRTAGLEPLLRAQLARGRLMPRRRGSILSRSPANRCRGLSVGAKIAFPDVVSDEAYAGLQPDEAFQQRSNTVTRSTVSLGCMGGSRRSGSRTGASSSM